MHDDQFLDEFPDVEDGIFPSGVGPVKHSRWGAKEAGKNPLLFYWEGLSRAGLAETTLRLGTHALLIALILLVAWGMRQFYLSAQVNVPREAVLAASLPTATPTLAPPELPPFTAETIYISGVPRLAQLHTSIPNRPRVDVITYTVEKLDTIFGIAEKFGLKPETILWGNYHVLRDDPHNLQPGQELNILPLNGTYYKWAEGDGLNGVAEFFGVAPEEIIEFPGNHLDTETIGDMAHPNIEPGAWLIIPGGTREFVNWSAPAISREDPGAAGSVLGAGACGSAVDGVVGAGAFIWPANAHFLSGYDYSPATNHSGIDIDGNLGDAIYASDNGVVVYAGWNDWGYGYMVVLNHGNGWQTLYAHMSAYNVYCGQSVYQGSVIGAIGSTGKSSGPHLHFEMMYNGSKVNPWDYVQ
jgi:hypothetical protein